MQKYRKSSISLSLAALIFSGFTAQATGVNLTSPNYQFDQQKLEVAEDSFNFLRSFVDYFYLSLLANKSNFPTIFSFTDTTSFCMGDAHPENFGVLLLKDRSQIFTANDVDDSAFCPVIMDLFRLNVSSEIYSSDVKIEKMLKAYSSGLQNKKLSIPRALSEMIKKSNKKGFTPNEKKYSGQKLIRDENTREVTQLETQQISAALSSMADSFTANSVVLDILASKKIGGGSGGLLRYEVLINVSGTLLQLEFKEEVRPSLYPVSSSTESIVDRLNHALGFFQGPQLSQYYKVVTVGSKTMLTRPRFAGNIGVELEKNSLDDNLDLIEYEFFTLGRLHRQSIQNPNEWIQKIESMNIKSYAKEVKLMSQFFENKFLSLK